MTEWTVGATDVLLDSCPHDGTWFDRDEIEQLAHAAASMRDKPAPQFARPAAGLAPVALAGAAAAIAVQAIAHGDGLHAADQMPPEQQSSTTEVALEAAIYAPDAAFVVAEVSAASAEVGIEAAGGLLEGLLEFIGGLFS